MSKVFAGGVPYAIDVKRLTEAFPVPSLTEGRVIKHENLEAIVNAPKGSQRYYAVINSWIHQLKNANGIFVAWESGTGIKILDPGGILTHTEIRTRQKIRQTGKAVKNYAWVDRTRLDTRGQQRLDHQTRVAAALRESLNAARREMAIELAPIQSLPKPKLIRDAS